MSSLIRWIRKKYDTRLKRGASIYTGTRWALCGGGASSPEARVQEQSSKDCASLLIIYCERLYEEEEARVAEAAVAAALAAVVDCSSWQQLADE